MGTADFALVSLLASSEVRLASSEVRLALASAAAALQRRSRLIPIRTARNAAYDIRGYL